MNKQNIISEINSIKSNYLPASANNLISCAVQVETLNFNTLLKNVQNSIKKYFYWAKPNDHYYFIGIDNLLLLENSNNQLDSDKHFNIANAKKSFFNNWGQYELESVPIIMGGMKFTTESHDTLWNDYHYSNWFIPKLIFLSHSEKYFVVFNFYNNRDSDIDSIINQADALLNECDHIPGKPFKIVHSTYNKNDFNNWSAAINSTLKNIKDDKLKKLVLSREVSIEFDRKPLVYAIIEKLIEKFPDCYTFLFRSGESLFFGASPEKLVTIKKNRLETDALAGSIKRGISKSEDDLLAQSLLSSEKNLEEQKAVTEFVIDSLTEYTEELFFEKKPLIKKLENIQHLWTPITGYLKPDVSVFDIIRKLHPTPAVCGVPYAYSLKLIKEYENHSRGLYSGVIGWFNFNNEADLAVGIRSALLKGKKLYAYSGCGIVDGSDAAAEYEESNLKLKPILSLFENGIIR